VLICALTNAHIADAAPNLCIVEIDIDRLPWDEEIFSAAPQFGNGHLVLPETPSWGVKPDEKAMRPTRREQAAGYYITASHDTLACSARTR
jgi:L-alanine-DL-glutamate epimerase-like enolase superfamily enzyme